MQSEYESSTKCGHEEYLNTSKDLFNSVKIIFYMFVVSANTEKKLVFHRYLQHSNNLGAILLDTDSKYGKAHRHYKL